jgi:hypothetical protein
MDEVPPFGSVGKKNAVKCDFECGDIELPPCLRVCLRRFTECFLADSGCPSNVAKTAPCRAQIGSASSMARNVFRLTHSRRSSLFASVRRGGGHHAESMCRHLRASRRPADIRRMAVGHRVAREEPMRYSRRVDHSRCIVAFLEARHHSTNSWRSATNMS